MNVCNKDHCIPFLIVCAYFYCRKIILDAEIVKALKLRNAVPAIIYWSHMGYLCGATQMGLTGQLTGSKKKILLLYCRR